MVMHIASRSFQVQQKVHSFWSTYPDGQTGRAIGGANLGWFKQFKPRREMFRFQLLFFVPVLVQKKCAASCIKDHHRSMVFEG